MVVQTAEAIPDVQSSGGQIAEEWSYQRGFEAALHPETFEQPYDIVTSVLQERYPTIYGEEAFRRGYARGQDYIATLQAI